MDHKTLLREYLRDPIGLAAKVVREARKDHTRLAKLAIKAEKRGIRRDIVAGILVDYYEGRISYTKALKKLKELAGIQNP